MKIQIIGFGLAGSWMAWELIRRGVDVVVTDRYNPNSSSRIAAGLINPINGTRPRPTWMADVLLPFAYRAYNEMSNDVNQPLLTRCKVRRVFLTQEDVRLWDHASTRQWYGNDSAGFNVMWEPLAPGVWEGIGYDFGGVEYEGAVVNTAGVIERVRKYVAEVDVPPDDVDFTIWCEGWEASRNDLWSWLPFQPVKGEILDAIIDGQPLTTIITRSIWIVPVGDEERTEGKQNIRIGSTYDWDDLTDVPTEQARSSLVSMAETILGRLVVVTGHRATVRPAARSKRPYLGIHPTHKKHAILNGFGAKGALWAPWAAHQLADHILDGTPVNAETNIVRWWNQ